MTSQKFSVFFFYLFLSFLTLGVSYWLSGRVLMFCVFITWLFILYFLFFRTKAFEKSIVQLGGKLLRGRDPFSLNETVHEIIVPFRFFPPIPILLVKTEAAPVSFLIRRWGRKPLLVISESLLDKLCEENPSDFKKGLMLFYHLFEQRPQGLFFETTSVLAEGLYEFFDALDEIIHLPLRVFNKQRKKSPFVNLGKPLFTLIWRWALRSIRWQRIDSEVSKTIGTGAYSRLVQLSYYFDEAFPDLSERVHLYVTFQNPNLRPRKSARNHLKVRYANFHGSEPSY